MLPKFIESIELPVDIEIETDNGFAPITHTHKTIEYQEFKVITETGKELICADLHLLFDDNYSEIYAKDLIEGKSKIITSDGPEIVQSLIKLDSYSNMFDVTVDSEYHRFYTNNILSHNTTSIAIYYTWCALFNESEKIGITANNGRLACEIVDKTKVIIENLPLFLQQGILEYNKANITLENGSEIRAAATTKNAFRGFSLTRCVMDELAHVEPRVAEEFYESIYPALSQAPRGQMSIASTPKGINNLYYKLWMDAVAGKNDFVPLSIRWDDVPRENQEAFRVQTIRNIGETRWRQEYLCEFLSESGCLIKPDVIGNIVRIDQIEINNNFKKYFEPSSTKKDSSGNIIDRGKTYVSCVDSAEGLGYDYSCIIIIDITEVPYQVVGVYRCNTVPPAEFAKMVVELSKYYNNSNLLIENNAVGSAVAELIINEHEYDNIIFTVSAKDKLEKISGGFGKNSSSCLRMTKKTKSMGCSALKHLIESGDLQINSEDIFKELVSFVRQGDTYAASPGSNDDLAMCLVMFGWLTCQESFKELINENIGIFAIDEEDNIEEDDDRTIDESITPFGYISSIDSDEDEFDWNF